MVTAVEASDTSDIGRIDVDEGSLTKMALEGPAVRAAAARTPQRGHAQVRDDAVLSRRSPPTRTTARIPRATQGFDCGGGPDVHEHAIRLHGVVHHFQQLLARAESHSRAHFTRTMRRPTCATRSSARSRASRQYLVNYQTAQQTIALQLLQIQSATENLRVQTQRYNIGTALQVDVTTAQAALDLAAFQPDSARDSTARTAKANIEALIGHDLRQWSSSAPRIPHSSSALCIQYPSVHIRSSL